MTYAKQMRIEEGGDWIVLSLIKKKNREKEEVQLETGNGHLERKANSPTEAGSKYWDSSSKDVLPNYTSLRWKGEGI